MSFGQKRGKMYYLYWREKEFDPKTKRYKRVLKGKPISTNRLTFLKYKEKFDLNKEMERLGMVKTGVAWLIFCGRYKEYSKTNKAPSTYSRDSRTIDLFNELCPIETVEQYTADLLEQYKTLRNAAGVMNSSINRELHTLWHMGTMLEKWHYTLANPVKGVSRMKEEKTKKRPFSAEDLRKIFRVRWFPWIYANAIGLYMGFRPKQVRLLKADQVDMPAHTMYKYSSKTNTDDTLLIPDRLYRVLEKLFKERKKRKIKSEYLICEKNGEPYSEQVFNVMAKKVFRRAGIKKASFYRFRHTFVTGALARGVTLESVADLAGHEDTRTTRNYKHFDKAHLNEEMKKIDFGFDINP